MSSRLLHPGTLRPVGIVLAAGRGERMGGPKAELVVGGERLMDRAVRLLRNAGCDPIAVVGRPEFSYPDVLALCPNDPFSGMRASLETALDPSLAFLAETSPVAVMLVDQPGLTSEGVRTIVSAWRPGRIAVGVISGQRVHPVVMEPTLWRSAIAIAGPDEGARRFLSAHPDLIDEVDVDGDPTDLDTPADLDRWHKRTS